MDTGRLIVDEPCRGSWNMAVDEALMLAAADSGTTTFRLYQWERPTLSLGYFQQAADRDQHRTSLECDIVRRSTGGGAIMHHHELTYSLAMPTKSRLSQDNQRLYQRIHRLIIDVLQGWEAEASLCCGAQRRAASDEPFLCFQRRADGDILLGDQKICGSAQRRREKAMLQHGSLLLKRSECAPELEGIVDLVNRDVEVESLASSLIQGVGEVLELDFFPSGLTNVEKNAAKSLETGRFAAKKWIYRR